MTPKYTSVKEIIAKVYRDLQLKEDAPWHYFVEWAGEALLHIGAYWQFKHTSTTLTVSNYKATLPCDFYELKMIGYNGQPLAHNTNAFELSRMDDVSGYISMADRHTYILDGCYIKTSFKEGLIEMAYVAVKSDDDGFPMIPDEVSYKEAIYRYIVQKWYYTDYITGKLPKYVYDDMVDDWHRYCMQARAQANMPTLDQMEAIKNMWVRLLPDINEHQRFFKNLNQRERLKLRP